jgi:hypothetical protein
MKTIKNISARKLNSMNMKFILLLTGLMLSISLTAQTVNKPSVAVANPNIDGLSITSTIVAKMMQLELVKLNKFSVYDEFDMAEILNEDVKYTDNCYGLKCLTSMGEALNVDYVLSGSYDGLGNKIAITLKWVDIKSGTINKSIVREFDNQETEIQRMIKLLLLEMNGMPIDPELSKSLEFKNEMIISNDVGKVNNSGPRVGYGYLIGSMNEFATRSESQGGLDIFPGVSNIGYQFEGQYVGTESFSALVEGVFTVSGLEQGLFIPSFALLNGFRFGSAGWEFAFGPSFTLKRTSNGFFDTDGSFGKGTDAYFSESDWSKYVTDNYHVNLGQDSTYLYDGIYTSVRPVPSDVIKNNNDYQYGSNLDARGSFKLSANWLMGFGRTFKAGALNIPVNIYYSSSKGGGMAGVSVGFNITQSKTNINGSNNHL